MFLTLAKKFSRFLFLIQLSVIPNIFYSPIHIYGSQLDGLSPAPIAVELGFHLYLPAIRNQVSTYYVSKDGNNVDGKSWATAWNELDQIDWAIVLPGDTIEIDGGPIEMVYTTTLRVERSGTFERPIKIALSNDPGRDGRVVIYGGRKTLLPTCGQSNYIFETVGVREAGILLDNLSWVIIDGQKWSGITIYGHNHVGILLRQVPNHIMIRNIEIFDNGWAKIENNEWEPDGGGVEFSGTSITFERMLVHDNGQDAFLSRGGNENFVLRQSWLYNSRIDESGKTSFNYCSHPDGVQIFSGGVQSGFLIEESIVGPGFMQGVLLGQSLTYLGQWATINNVTLRNDVFTKAVDNNVYGYPTTKAVNWVLDHVTIHCPNTKGQCLSIEGSGHRVIDTIIHSGRIYFPDGLSFQSGNCQWNTIGFTIGMTVDPLFTNIRSDPFSLDDYSLLSGSPCTGKGSSLTSVDQLLSWSD